MIVEKVLLEDINTVCCSLGKLVEPLLEPYSQAMIIESSGELTFTRRGMKVLLESCPGHPLAKLIIQAVNKYNINNGDDCKIFLVLIKEIISGIKNKFTSSHQIDIRSEMSSHLVHFRQMLPEIFKKLRSFSYIVSPSADLELFLKHLEGLVLTALSTKFSFHVAEKLTKLFCEFLCASISDWNTAFDTLSYMSSHFDSFCSKATSSFHDSIVLRGFVLKPKLDLKVNSLNDVHYVIIHEVPQKITYNYSVQQNENLKPLLENYWLHIQNAISRLSEQGISMILTPSVASENIKSVCQQTEVTLIDRISNEDIDFIITSCDISPLNCMYDKFDAKNIGFFNSVKSLMYGKYSCVQLEVNPRKNAFTPHHMILCAPVETLGKECFAEIFNCLKIVKNWLSFVKPDDEGVIEEKLQSLKLTTTSIVGVSYPTGLWELLFKESLHSICSFQNLFEVLDIALLRVICKNWDIKTIDYCGKDSYEIFHERMKLTISIPIEAASIKENLIYCVFSLIQQILKVDAIVCRK